MTWWQALLVSFGDSVGGGFVGSYVASLLASVRAARHEEQRLGIDPEDNHN